MNKMDYYIFLRKIRDKIPEASQSDFDLQFSVKEKSPSVALVLSIFFGTLGIDRFYAGRIVSGLLKLFTLGGFGLWAIIDWFLIMGVVRSKNIEIAFDLGQVFNCGSRLTLDDAESGMDDSLNKINLLIFSIMVIGASVLVYNSHKELRNSQALRAKYTLTRYERAVLDVLLREEVSRFASEGDTVLKRELAEVASADQISAAYDQNQVASDQKYYKKKLFLSGYIKNINSGLGNAPYLVLYGTNQFQSPQARFIRGSDLKIASLRKRQKIYMVCEGGGAIVGTPVFEKCQFADDYAKDRVAQLNIEILTFLEGKKMCSLTASRLAVMAISIGRLLPPSSACFTANDGKCIEEMGRIIKNNDKKIVDVVEELRLLGINFPNQQTSNRMI